MKKYLEYFDGAFDSTVAEKVKPENKPYVAYSKTEGVVYSIISKIVGVYYDALTLKNTKIPVITYGEVDLGLPSCIKWADRNVGAENPWDNGAYFSWGSTSGVSIIGIEKWLEDDLMRIYLIEQEGVPADTVTQEMIDMVKSQFGENIKTIIEDYLKRYGLISGTTFEGETTPYYSGVDDNNNPLFSKYNEDDGLTVLEAIDDAATSNMGSDWRMPTSAEIIELVENTDHYYIGEDGSIVAGPFNYETNTSDKGLDGSKLRSICFVKKGENFDYDNRTNFIEFPFADNCFGTLLSANGQHGRVWSSSVYNNDGEYRAYELSFATDGHLYYDDDDSSRFYGLPVRGVQP